MTGSKKDLVKYRLSWAWDTLEDPKILADRKRWNSTINRLLVFQIIGVYIYIFPLKIALSRIFFYIR